jgi:NADH:ubiquinone oxidoreductase subunit F (NADH-binding)
MTQNAGFREAQNSFLLSALHEAAEKEGSLSRKTLEGIAKSQGIPLAELTGFIRFFHYFQLDGEIPPARGDCLGPVCSLPATHRDSSSDGSGIACPGLCDQGGVTHGEGGFCCEGGELGGYTPACEVPSEEVLLKYGRALDPQRLETYRSMGGYLQYLDLVSRGDGADALNQIESSGLRGRGGAAFPLASKLRAVRSQPDLPKYVVCNADEGEPATFKDRVLLHLEPHLLLEGMMICGYLVGASRGIIYLRYEYPDALQELEAAIAESREAGLLGNDLSGDRFGFEIEIVRGAGSYVCGEETALLNSLEGKMPWPRERPPFPTEAGLFGRPTLLNNVETFCCLPPLLEGGADWFRSLGKGESAGTKIYSVSGRVVRPGNYELPLGVSARELIVDIAGGTPGGELPKAFTLGGVSGGLLGRELLDLSLDYQAPGREDFFLGSGGIVVLDESCCVVDFVRSCLLFFEAESCGKCFPCRVGAVRLREFLDGLTGRSRLPSDAQLQAEEIHEMMSAASACGLGQSVPLLIVGMFRYFEKEFEEHLQGRFCRSEVCPL